MLAPVVERELRAALHRRNIRWSRLKVAGLSVLAVSLFLLSGGPRFLGGTLHFYLFIGGLNLAVWPAIQNSVGLFAEERRQQTLELLYLTGMGSGELFIGKLLGGALVASCDLLALVPMLAVPFLSGGLAFNLFAATAACLPTIFVLVLAFGSLASAMCKEEGSAMTMAGTLLGVVCLAVPLPYMMGFWLTGAVPFSKSWLLLSPAMGPCMVFKDLAGFTPGDFWTWTAVAWAWSAVCLVAAAILLKRNWRRDLERTGAPGSPGKWNSFVQGNVPSRAALRRRVLGVNAYQWLTRQDRRTSWQAWGFLGLVCVLWLLGWCLWPHLWPGTANFYLTALVLLSGMELLVTHAAARQMAADRRSGGLELLLTTPLNPDEMLAGQKLALAEQFGPVQLGVSGLMLLMLLAGARSRPFTPQGIVSYLVVWSVFFVWCWRPVKKSAALSMWVAANCGRPLYGLLRTKGSLAGGFWTLYWIWSIGNVFGAFGTQVRLFPTGSTTEMLIVQAVVIWLLLFMATKRKSFRALEASLVSQLRLIAQEPLPEHNDPRYQQWQDVRTRFPEPPGGRAGFPGEALTPEKPVKASGAWLWRPLGKVCGRVWGRVRRAKISSFKKR